MAVFSASKEGCARAWARRFEEATTTEEAINAHRIMRVYVNATTYMDAVKTLIVQAGGSFEDDVDCPTSEASR